MRGRPARSSRASSYDRAIAWIVARLAEALDHAFSRDVAHGDVKPSNILLSADGNPMLLDFNLARDGALAVDDPSRAVDLGGTLAYMSPERLRALASFEPPLDDIIGEPETECDPDPSLTERAPHLADLYALGMVLLEALTGRPPLAIKVPDARDPASRRVLMRSAARVYARPASGVPGRSSATPKSREAGPSRPASRRSSCVASIPTRPVGMAAPWSWPRTWTAGAPTGRWPLPTSRSGG